MAAMIYPGTDLKFRITATQPDFQLSEDWFEIRIKDQYGRVRYTIGKSDCFWDDQGAWYFVMDDVRKGVYFAFFHGRYEDEDYDDQRRDFTDAQELCRVGYCGGTCHCKCKHAVQYEQVWTVSIDGEDYLCDCDGKYILTADGNRICFKNNKQQHIEDMGKVRLDTLTGDEFKLLIEGRSQDGKTDTIPEIIDALRGIDSETTTVKEDVDVQIDESVADQTATHDDVDEIFHGQKPTPEPEPEPEPGSDTNADDGSGDV